MIIRLDNTDFEELMEMWVDKNFYSSVFLNWAVIKPDLDGELGIEIEVVPKKSAEQGQK